MEMKEFYYKDGIRVSLFNLDHKAVPFHYHQTVSDIILCSKGLIEVELPEQKKKYSVHEGEVFQIPCRTKHRFANGAQPGRLSRYVLMQIGNFDIDFIKDSKSMQALLNGIFPEVVSKAPVYIEDRKEDIMRLAKLFAESKPEELTDEENNDVIMALRLFASKGIESEFPSRQKKTLLDEK